MGSGSGEAVFRVSRVGLLLSRHLLGGVVVVVLLRFLRVSVLGRGLGLSGWVNLCRLGRGMSVSGRVNLCGLGRRVSVSWRVDLCWLGRRVSISWWVGFSRWVGLRSLRGLGMGLGRFVSRRVCISLSGRMGLSMGLRVTLVSNSSLIVHRRMSFNMIGLGVHLSGLVGDGSMCLDVGLSRLASWGMSLNVSSISMSLSGLIGRRVGFSRVGVSSLGRLNMSLSWFRLRVSFNLRCLGMDLGVSILGRRVGHSLGVRSLMAVLNLRSRMSLFHLLMSDGMSLSLGRRMSFNVRLWLSHWVGLNMGLDRVGLGVSYRFGFGVSLDMSRLDVGFSGLARRWVYLRVSLDRIAGGLVCLRVGLSGLTS